MPRLLDTEDDGERLSITDFLKFINLKVVLWLLAQTWEQISSLSLQKAWQNIGYINDTITMEVAEAVNFKDHFEHFDVSKEEGEE